MMAAVQPFISGAISKTINMPKESDADEIASAYMEGWKLGFKAVAIYRDGSKRLQPVNTDNKTRTRRKSRSKKRPHRVRSDAAWPIRATALRTNSLSPVTKAI